MATEENFPLGRMPKANLHVELVPPRDAVKIDSGELFVRLGGEVVSFFSFQTYLYLKLHPVGRGVCYSNQQL